MIAIFFWDFCTVTRGRFSKLELVLFVFYVLLSTKITVRVSSSSSLYEPLHGSNLTLTHDYITLCYVDLAILSISLQLKSVCTVVIRFCVLHLMQP